MPHRFLFVMDPLSQVLVDKDTTFAFMLEAVARGHEVYFAGLKDLVARGHQPYAFARRCEVARATPHYKFLDEGSRFSARAFPRDFHAQGSSRRCAVRLRGDAARAGRHAPHLRHQSAQRAADRERKALSTKFSRGDSAHAGNLRSHAPAQISDGAGRADDRQAARRSWRRRRVPGERRRSQPRRDSRNRHSLRDATHHGAALHS